MTTQQQRAVVLINQDVAKKGPPKKGPGHIVLNQAALTQGLAIGFLGLWGFSTHLELFFKGNSPKNPRLHYISNLEINICRTARIRLFSHIVCMRGSYILEGARCTHCTKNRRTALLELNFQP